MKHINLLTKNLIFTAKTYLYTALDIFIYASFIFTLLSLVYFFITIFVILCFPDFFLNVTNTNMFYLTNSEQLAASSSINSELYINNTSPDEEIRPDPHRINIESKLSYKSINKIKTYYSILINKTRRRLYWEIVEHERNNYSTYKDFKENWDPSIKIRNEFKKEIKSDLHELLLFKKTTVWILKRLNPRNVRPGQ